MHEALISKFVDDPESLSEAEVTALLAALREHPELAGKLKAHLQLNELLSRRGAGRSDLLARVAYRVQEEGELGAPLDPTAIKVEAERRRGRLGRPTFPRWTLGLAAAVLLLAGALSLLLTSDGSVKRLAGAGNSSPKESTTPSPTPSPTPKSTPSPTPNSTPIAPTPTPTPTQATPTPAPTPTPERPTSTPIKTPTATPKPSPTPAPKPTAPLPTPAPIPTPSDPRPSGSNPHHVKPRSEGRGPRVLSVAGRVRVVEEGAPDRALVVGVLVSAEQTLVAEPGARATIAYSDSTTLTLARGAVVRLEPSPKRVFLEGGVLVAEVAKQDRDMVVETPHAEIRVLGTRFVLDAKESSTRVQVDSGRIRLKSRSNRRSIEVPEGEFAVAARGIRLVSRPLRASQGLLVLYEFKAGEGTAIHDRSGRPQPLDLKIESPQAVAWLPQGGLLLRKPAQIVSERPAKAVVERVVATQEITLEAWIRPSQSRVRGTEIRRVFTFSLGYHDKNFQFGQLEDTFAGLVRPNLGPARYDLLRSGRKSVRKGLTHVVFTRDRSKLQLYVNGKLSSSKPAEGDFGTWDRRFFLRLGNERLGAPQTDSGSTSWLGTYYLIAIYERALTRVEVGRNFESRF